MKVICNYKFCLLTGWGLLWLVSAFAQPDVQAHTSSRRILIGDPVYVWLEVHPQSPEDQVEWPQFSDSINGLEWVERGRVDTIRGKDTFLLRQKLTFTGFDSGRFFIPSFRVEIRRPHQPPKVFRTDSFPLEVQTIAVDTTKAFKPIKGIIAVRTSWLDYWKELLGGMLILALIIFLVYYFIRKKRAKRPAADQVPPEKAHERALRLLMALKDEKLWQAGRIKEYYDQLSVILRNYFENRFSIAAMEQTTDELLAQTHKMRVLKPFRKELRMILQTADLAKFARAEPLPDEQEACMDAAIRIVQQTKLITEEVQS